MLNIKSTSNKTYKFIKSLLLKKSRNESGCFLVEGIKSVGEALASNLCVRIVAVSENSIKKCADLICIAQKKGIEIYLIGDSLFSSLCDTKTPEGIICVVKMHQRDELEYKNGLYLYCDNVADPGNAGTLIRCADAVGASGVFFSKGSVDIYNPKTVRATMGSLFHLPVYDAVNEKVLLDMKNRGFSILAGALNEAAIDYRRARYMENMVIVVGNEANGISDSVIKIADKTVIIPMVGRAESLNVSVAGAILMYEWRRNNSVII